MSTPTTNAPRPGASRTAAAGAPDLADVEMVLAFARRMGVSVGDLAASTAREPVPTFAEYVPRVIERMPAPSCRIYGPYWTRIVAAWEQRRLDEPDEADILGLLETARRNALVRRTGTGGNGAALHTFYALGAVYRWAVTDRILTARQNPMDRVSKPRKGKSRRHAITPGNDPELDALLLRFHLETGARTGGALALRLVDLNTEESLVRLWEKAGTHRWQPVSPTLMRYLTHHARVRGAVSDESTVFRFDNGNPLTKKRYETLWKRIGANVRSAQVLGISTHWLRHTTLTWVERNFGVAVARAYAGHAEPTSNHQGVTHVYVKATLTEVATALQALTQEPHPLAGQPLHATATMTRTRCRPRRRPPPEPRHDHRRRSAASVSLGRLPVAGVQKTTSSRVGAGLRRVSGADQLRRRGEDRGFGDLVDGGEAGFDVALHAA